MTTPKSNARSAVIWNILGSGMNAATTMLLTVVASRLVGIEASGILSLAFGLCFIFGTIASFEVRAYQSTDITGRFSFGEYLGARWISCGAAFLLMAGYIVLQGYESDKALVVFFVCLFKIIESFSDVYHGMFQVRDHLEYAGQSLFIRNLLGCILYTIVLLVLHNPVCASLVLPAASLICYAVFDKRKAALFEKQIRPSFSLNAIKHIAQECWPLASSSIMSMYFLNATKLNIDRYIPQMQGYWTALFMPAAFINLFGLFVFRPMLTGMTDLWNRGEYKAFWDGCVKLCAVITLLGIAVVAGGAWLGIPILEWLYGITLQDSAVVLIIVLIGGVFNALATFFWHVLIMIRRQNCVLIGDTAAFAFSLFAIPIFVRTGALLGAAQGYMLNMLLRLILLMVYVFFGVRKAKANV